MPEQVTGSPLIGYIRYNNELSESKTHEINLFPIAGRVTFANDFAEVEFSLLWTFSISFTFTSPF
jgi:hypothetical protein